MNIRTNLWNGTFSPGLFKPLEYEADFQTKPNNLESQEFSYSSNIGLNSNKLAYDLCKYTIEQNVPMEDEDAQDYEKLMGNLKKMMRYWKHQTGLKKYYEAEECFSGILE